MKRSTLICFDAATKIYNSISEETKTIEVHQGQFATPNAMTYLMLWHDVNTILSAANSMINGTGNWQKDALKAKFKCES